MAMAAGGRSVAEAWPGRFILGLGVSHAPMVNARGHDYARPVSAMREYLDQMGHAQWRAPEAPLPPVVLAALGPRMVALAAERTAGSFPYFSTAEHIRRVREQMGPEPFLAADLPVVLAAERAEARSIGDAHMNVYLRTDNYRNNLLRLGWNRKISSRRGRMSSSMRSWLGGKSHEFKSESARSWAAARTRWS